RRGRAPHRASPPRRGEADPFRRPGFGWSALRASRSILVAWTGTRTCGPERVTLRRWVAVASVSAHASSVGGPTPTTERGHKLTIRLVECTGPDVLRTGPTTGVHTRCVPS